MNFLHNEEDQYQLHHQSLGCIFFVVVDKKLRLYHLYCMYSVLGYLLGCITSIVCIA